MFKSVISKIRFLEAPQGVLYFNTGDEPVNNPPPANQPPTNQPKTFTQEQVNAMVAEDKRKLAQRNQELSEQLKKIQESENLTVQQKEELQQRIDQLAQESQSKENQLKIDVEKLQKKLKDETERLGNETNIWKSRFEKSMIIREITDAAVNHKAFQPRQIVKELLENSRVQEAQDENGKPTGEFTTRIKMTKIEEGKKPLDLDLTPEEAVKLMTELPDQYGNLFQSGSVPGIGGNNQPKIGSNKRPPIDKMSMEDYKKDRDAILSEVTNQGDS